MASNHLEQLVAEWLEYRGYFVRRNVLVGRRAKGGYECELDVVAFNPHNQDLLHVEASMDALKWTARNDRYGRKFELGRKYVPSLFKGLSIPKKLRQLALVGFGSKKNRTETGGGQIVLLADLLLEILGDLQARPMHSQAVPEQFALLRTLQCVADSKKRIWTGLESGAAISVVALSTEPKAGLATPGAPCA